MQNLISSQKYINADTVAEKMAARDFACSIYPLTVEGVDYLVLVDGHHSYAAAAEAGVAPEISMVSNAIRAEYDAIPAMDWLESHQMDADWYFVATGKAVWQ